MSDLNAAAAALRQASAKRPARRTLREPCRCGWADENPTGPEPKPYGEVVDLRGTTDNWLLSRAQYALNPCHSCNHLIHIGSLLVSVTPTRGSLVRYRFHRECVVLPGETT